MARRVLVWLACLLGLLVGMVATAGEAHADGDPASDVLAARAVFLPPGRRGLPRPAISAAGAGRSAVRAGFSLRVALVATRSDLGSVTALWRRPAAYARFLGQELSRVFHGTLLVVMPNGFGVARAGTTPAVALPPAAALAAPGPAAALGGAAIAAVRRLAAAAGHPLDCPAQPRRGPRQRIREPMYSPGWRRPPGRS